MNLSLKTRLSVAMFAQSSLMGLLMPLISLYLKKNLGFSGIQIGWVLSMYAVSAMTAPMIGAILADRWISSERYLSISYLLVSFLFYLLSFQTSFFSFFLIYLLLMLVLTPTESILNAIVLHHLENGREEFGKIRVFGTIGWIVAGWSFSYLWLKVSGEHESADRLKDLLPVCTLVSLCLFLYSITLPQTPVLKKKGREKKFSVIPKEAFFIFKKMQLVVTLFFGLTMTVIFRMYYLSASIFLSQLGFKDSNILPAMSLSQSTEIFMMFAMGFFLNRLGFKSVFLIALFMQWIKFSLFLISDNHWFILSGLLADGISYVFSLAAIILFFDAFTDKENRTPVHQLYALCIYGFGSFLGDNIAGFTLDTFRTGNTIDFSRYWLIPWLLSIFGVLWIAIMFKEKKESNRFCTIGK